MADLAAFLLELAFTQRLIECGEQLGRREHALDIVPGRQDGQIA